MSFDLELELEPTGISALRPHTITDKLGMNLFSAVVHIVRGLREGG